MRPASWLAAADESSALNTGAASHGDSVVSGEMLWQSVLPCQQRPTSAEWKAKASYGITAAVFYWVGYAGEKHQNSPEESGLFGFVESGGKFWFLCCFFELFNCLAVIRVFFLIVNWSFSCRSDKKNQTSDPRRPPRPSRPSRPPRPRDSNGHFSHSEVWTKNNLQDKFICTV